MRSERKRKSKKLITTMPLKETEGLYESLKAEWKKKDPNLSICGELLSKLKISMLELDFLPTAAKRSEKDLLLARDVLEIGALWSILKKDIPSFKRYVDQLRNYYFDYNDVLSESPRMYQLLGLNLLFLLSQNHLSEFHTELEKLNATTITTNDYIRHPVSLEQYLMEGSYNKVFLAKGNIPAETVRYATFFIDILLDTTRDAIASCLEKAYEQIQFNEATHVLFFNSPEKMSEYARNRGWSRRSDGYYTYSTQQQRTEKVTTASESTEMAHQVMKYARELEMIV